MNQSSRGGSAYITCNCPVKAALCRCAQTRQSTTIRHNHECPFIVSWKESSDEGNHEGDKEV